MVHFDGNSWSAATSPVTDELHAVLTLPDGQRWIVGGGRSGPWPILHWSGTAWESWRVDWPLAGVAVDGDVVLAFGVGRSFRRQGQGRWRAISAGWPALLVPGELHATPWILRAEWGTSFPTAGRSTDRGISFTHGPANPSHPWMASMSGTASDVYAVGEGALLHSSDDFATWDHELGTPQGACTFEASWAGTDGHAWAVGTCVALTSDHGALWAVYSTSEHFHGVWSAGPGATWLVADSGAIYQAP